MNDIALTQEVLSLNNPHKLMEFGGTLKEYIVKNKLFTKIGQTQYAHVDGWKFAGANFGLTAVVNKPQKISNKGEYILIGISNENTPWGVKDTVTYVGYKEDSELFDRWKKKVDKKYNRFMVKPHFAYECDCEIRSLNNGQVISTGTGFCSNLELKKAQFDEYSINSMAQTRSIGKAYRNLLGYVMNAAGFSSTPAEEMEEDHFKEPEGKRLPELTPDHKHWKAVVQAIKANQITIEDLKKRKFTLSEENENKLKEELTK